MVQEYGRYFGMPTCCLRGGCLTGPNHSGVELHGFLSYLVKCNVEEREYTRLRLQGQAGARQHPLARRGALHCTRSSTAPRRGEVYNLGGGKANSCSILEAFAMAERMTRQAAAIQLRRTAREPAITSATTATCARCRRTIRAGTSRSRSTTTIAEIVDACGRRRAPDEQPERRRMTADHAGRSLRADLRPRASPALAGLPHARVWSILTRDFFQTLQCPQQRRRARSRLRLGRVHQPDPRARRSSAWI